jgi:thiamine kinase-like enzyme
LRRRPADWEPRFDRLLADLVAAEALDPGAARETARLAVLHAPRTASVGLCHTDFCGENIVTDAAGTVFVIDNEGIAVDAYEYDLARTWYRWPMTELQQRAYAEGYGDHDHATRFASHFLYWALMALVESSAVRVRVRAASARIPLSRLAELLRSHGRGERFPRLLSRG